MSIEGYVDQLTPDGLLSGWVRDLTDPERRLRVEARLGKAVVAAATANRLRPDLRAAGLAHGEYGYEMRLGRAVIEAAERADGPLLVLAGDRELGRLSLGGDALPEAAQSIVGPLITAFVLKQKQAPDPQGIQHPSPSYLALFEPAFEAGLVGRRAPSAFVDSTRRRHGGDQLFDPLRYAADLDGCYLWYLENFCAKQKPRAAPLSRQDLEHLNEPVLFGPDGRCLTRVMLAQMTAVGAADQVSAVQDADAYGRLLHWWTGEADRLGVEDCLVPELLRSALREVKPSARLQRLPLSTFMEQHRRLTPELSALGSTSSFGVRAAIYVHLLLMAADRPGLGAYLPAKGLAELSQEAENRSLFDTLIEKCAASSPKVTWRLVSAALRAGGFDLDSGAWRTTDSSGHRLESALHGRPSADEQCDVQLIGPIGKASGLGQAARLSASLLERSGLAVNLINFDLENPAPVLDKQTGPSRPKRARINLIHLNAETVPLAVAMLPDVFSDAYNIIYPFWELNAPAPAQALGLQLADEVWVASEFGRSTFAPYTDDRVSVVGMTFEAEAPPRSVARAALVRRYPSWRDRFVFLSTFDAFSYVQRKNPLGVIEAFLHAFPRREDVRLLLKTHNRDYVRQPQQRKVWAEVSRLVQNDPRIELLNETLPYAQTLELKRGCDCYVSLHRSEGWGFGLIEAMGLGVPVVATAYSGNMDFCTPETAYLVDYDLVPVRHGEYAYASEGQVWAEPRLDSAAAALRAVVDDPTGRERRIAAALEQSHRNFGPEAVGPRYRDRLTEILRSKSV
jgi:glycosyltransferase involved in cell wall biosynthesis